MVTNMQLTTNQSDQFQYKNRKQKKDNHSNNIEELY